MNWRAHIFIGVAAGAFAAYLLHFSLPDSLIFTAISGAASLLPDLDIRNSKASKATYSMAILAVLVVAYLLSFAKGGGLGDFISSFVMITAALLAIDFIFRPRHRGAMHSAPFALAAALGCYAIFGAFASGAFLIGYCSHLAADATH